MEKCVIWGAGGDYEQLLNQILFEIYKGNIEVEALVCRKEDKYCMSRDGFPVIIKEELRYIEYDWIIVTSSKYYKEIRQEAKCLNINETRVIDGEVLKIPLFDFKRYIELIVNPITILSDDCWGGYVYHYLKLPFSSPLINIYWEKEEYYKFIKEPLFYLQTELTMVQDGDFHKGRAPVGELGDDERKVRMQLLHNTCFTEAKEQWDRRMQRINIDNIFIKFGFDCQDQNYKAYLSEMEKIRYKKISFFINEGKDNNSFKTERFEWNERKQSRVDSYHYYDYMRANYMFSLDILKLLTGTEYSREG